MNYDLLVAVTIITVLSGDLILLVLPNPPRIKIRWTILWHVPFWAACLYIGLHWSLPHFAIPVRIVQ